MQLVTTRLIVRDFVEADWPDVFAFGSDPMVVHHMPFGPCTAEQAPEHVKEWMASAQETPRRIYDMGIELKGADRIIGACTLHVWDDQRQQAAFRYLLNRRYWGQGYMTEAMRALFGYGFETLGLHRISDTVDPENVGSIRVLEKLGMTCEGRHRVAWRQKGERRDELIYALLDHEWRASCRYDE